MPKILKVQDNIMTIEGKFSYQMGSLFDIDESTKGYLLSADHDSASLLLIGDVSSVSMKKNVKLSKTNFENIEVYDNYFGSIISPFGKILEGNKKTKGKKIGSSTLFNDSPAILDRVKLTNPIKTGILSIDTMIPIGKGQRELIIGDRSTGKSSIAINTILNQKDTNVKVIYVAVGQKRSSVISTYDMFKQNNFNNVITIFSSPDSSPEQFFAPFIGMAMAEALAYKGEEVLVVLDDLTKHANIYREISLIIGKAPGRESYPADIFYQHARLLERSGKFNDKYKNGSITCLPIVETVQGDVASSIPSNIISITDGQIFTSTELFNSGDFPAINIGMSVSRTGSSVQTKKMREMSKKLKATYSKLSEVKKFTDMSIEISDSLKKQIDDWNSINNILTQFGYSGYSEEQMQILIELFNMGKMANIKERNKFSIAFNKYCNDNKFAKKIIEKINKNVYKNIEKLRNDIDIIFGPLVKIASEIKDDVITLKEYQELKGDI